MAAAVVFPVAYLGMGLARGWDPLGRQLPLLVFALLMAVMIVYKHRGNIARLRAGTENRVGAKRASEPPLAA
jgi:glycerol-3-phosphate acyltransferase PlsY